MASETSVSHDFLAQGTLLAGNLQPNDQGEVVVPREALDGNTTLVVLAVHPLGLDSRNVLLPYSALKKRDLRLKSAFDAQTHLAETQSVRVLKLARRRPWAMRAPVEHKCTQPWVMCIDSTALC